MCGATGSSDCGAPGGDTAPTMDRIKENFWDFFAGFKNLTSEQITHFKGERLV